MRLLAFSGQLAAISMKTDSGAAGWAATAAVIVGYDLWAILTKRQTMSAWFGRQLKHPCRRSVLAAIWALLTWHLFGGRPDPLRWSLDPASG